MKVEPTLSVVKAQAQSETGPRKQPQKHPAPSQDAPPGVVLLISRENQQARLLTPQSLKEAEDLLLQVQHQLARGEGGATARVHGLTQSCLVRLVDLPGP
jgi:hypothetical protein